MYFLTRKYREYNIDNEDANSLRIPFLDVLTEQKKKVGIMLKEFMFYAVTSKTYLQNQVTYKMIIILRLKFSESVKKSLHSPCI